MFRHHPAVIAARLDIRGPVVAVIIWKQENDLPIWVRTQNEIWTEIHKYACIYDQLVRHLFNADDFIQSELHHSQFDSSIEDNWTVYVLICRLCYFACSTYSHTCVRRIMLCRSFELFLTIPASSVSQGMSIFSNGGRKYLKCFDLSSVS